VQKDDGDKAKAQSALLTVALAWLPILTPVVGAVWAVYLFTSQHQVELKTRYFEAQKAYREKQLELYFATSDVTAKMIWETSDSKEWEDDSKLLKKLFYQVSLVGDQSMLEPLETYVGEVKLCEEQKNYNCGNYAPVRAAAHERLMKAFRKSLDLTWRGTPP
jgi:hypothetical protein